MPASGANLEAVHCSLVLPAARRPEGVRASRGALVGAHRLGAAHLRAGGTPTWRSAAESTAGAMRAAEVKENIRQVIDKVCDSMRVSVGR